MAASRRAMLLLDRLQQLPEAEREAVLLAEAGDDPELLAEVRQLLARRAPEDFLEKPTVDLGKLLSGELLVGRRFGDWIVTRALGAGGMGQVCHVRHEVDGGTAVVKLLPIYLRSNVVAYERFCREVETLQAIRHPAIVPVLDSDTEAVEPWFAMPLVDGHDLGIELDGQRDERIERAADPACLLPPFGTRDYALAVVQGVLAVAEALGEVHRQGIVHRDIKPTNLLLDREGGFHLTDFGLAHLVDSTLTASDDAVGTLQYMSPEQVRALRRDIDDRSDVYSLSVVLYELLCLRPPYEGANGPELIKRISSGRHAWLGRANPDLNRELVLICEQGMAWDPVDRYQSADALADDLRRFLNRERVRARAPGWRSRLRSWSRQHPVAATLSASLPLALALAWLALLWLDDRRQEQDWRQAMEAALELPDWQGRETGVLDGLTAAREARRRGDLGAESWSLVDRLGERERADLAARLERIEALRRSGLGRQRLTADGDLLSAPSVGDLMRSVELAGRGLMLHPQDPDLTRLAALDGTYLDLDVDWAPGADRRWAASARLLALPRDRATDTFGEPLDLGPLPVAERLPPGSWRFVVSAPGAWPAEFDRQISWDLGDERLRVTLRPRESDPEGFVRLPAVRLVLDTRRRLGCSLVGDVVDLPAFWIGEAEVSNREYLAFLEATGHPPPKLWDLVGYSGDWTQLPGVDGDPRFLDLPVTGLSVYDMRSFAEWAGARLPTHLELEYALRGPEMWTELPAGTLANIDGPDASLPASGRNERFRRYLAQALPVREPGYRQPPFDLFHAVGNVAEFSSTPLTERHRGVLHADVTRHIHMGGAWDAVVDGDALPEHAHWGTDEAYVAFDRGFRLVRSEPAP